MNTSANWINASNDKTIRTHIVVQLTTMLAFLLLHPFPTPMLLFGALSTVSIAAVWFLHYTARLGGVHLTTAFGLPSFFFHVIYLCWVGYFASLVSDLVAWLIILLVIPSLSIYKLLTSNSAQ